MEDACDVSGNHCKLKNPSNCNNSIQSLVNTNSEFKGCLCTDDLYCTIGKMFGQKCINESEESTLASNLTSQSNTTQWLYEIDMSLIIPRSDCVMATHFCQDSEHCTLLYENFKRNCGRESERCKTLEGSHLCAALSKGLRGTILWNCQCNDHSKSECVEIWKSLFEDVCVPGAQRNQIPAISEEYDDEFNQYTVSDNKKEDNKVKWNLSTLSSHGINGILSCMEVAEACVGDMVCNTQLAPYLKACSANGSLCDVKHCQAAIRFFYQNMPFNIAQMLAFCDCAQSDLPCQQSKEALHSKPCAMNIVPPPTCLNVIHSCRNDELCR
ncbi:GDNF family receptor alpha-like isoform X2 [Erinaceus europaeus]|uniref:GDNF family receptor alpha-like isoform X2 n=1 Tax=Erinaceus europaeus TaxID=9365 RepID=A0ABM3XAZ0_ERIEU|nr:GDNF family receptor alpha-like isoform X2 [Erinaceus europaeus]